MTNEQKVSDNALAETVFEAVLSSSHRITHDEVVLFYDSWKPGKNALAQLHARIRTALRAAPPVSTGYWSDPKTFEATPEAHSEVGVKAARLQIAKLIMLEIQGYDFGRGDTGTDRFTCSMAQIDLLAERCNAAADRVLAALVPEAGAVEAVPVAEIDTSKGWLIYKDGRGWYRPDAQGYTNDTRQAGRYSKEDAEAYSHPNGWAGPRDGITIRHESALNPTPSVGKKGEDK